MAPAAVPTIDRTAPLARQAEPSRPGPSGVLWRTVAVRLVVAILAGALHGAAWLIPGTWYCAWVGQAGLIFLGFLAAPRTAFAYGFLAGAICTGSAFYWGIEALGATMDASRAVAFCLYALLIAFEAIAFGLFCGAVSMIARRGPRRYWLIPCVLVAIDSWYPRIFAWKLGYSQLEWIDLVQIAEWVGSDGIGFVVTGAAAIPAVLWLGSRPGAEGHRKSAADRGWRFGYVLAAATLLILTLGLGSLRKSQWAAWAAQQPNFTVAMVQIDPVFMGSEEKLRQRSLAVRDRVDLVCWPESAIGVYSDELTHFRDVERTLELSRESQTNLQPTKDFRCHLLAGGKLYSAESSREGPFYMAAFLTSPTQDILGKYKKRTLLPLGEYVPGQSFYPPLRRWMTIEHIIHAGKDPSPLQMLDGTKLGVLLCYEDTIPRNARHTTVAGAELLISLIHGTAFENPLTLIQHERLARLRAVENRRYFLRCSSTGITCVIAPTGEVLGSLEPQSEGTLLSQVTLVTSRTVYHFLGDTFGWACAFLCLVWLIASRDHKARC